MCKIHRASTHFMQVPDRFQQVPTLEIVVSYRASLTFTQVPLWARLIPSEGPSSTLFLHHAWARISPFDVSQLPLWAHSVPSGALNPSC